MELSQRTWVAALIIAMMVGMVGALLTRGGSMEEKGLRRASTREAKAPAPRDVEPIREPVSEKPPLSVDGHPNVLFVVWDSVRADRLSAYGHDRPTTPFLEEMAAESVVFEQAVSPSYWALPARASMLTGLPVSAHGVTAGRRRLVDSYVTLPEHLRDAGYDTYLFTATAASHPSTHLVQGFEAVDGPMVKTWRQQITKYDGGKRLDDDQSLAHAKARTIDQPKDAGPFAGKALLSWLDERGETERPFFAMLDMAEASMPRRPSMDARKAVIDDPQVIAAGLATRADLAFLHSASADKVEIGELQAAGLIGVYDASIRELDDGLKSVIRGLETRGVLDQTVVVVTSGSGEAFGEHGVWSADFGLHAEHVHVPLVVHHPARLEAKRVAEPVSLSWLYGTLASYVDVTAPQLPVPAVDLLSGPLGEPVFSQFLVSQAANTIEVLGREDEDWRRLGVRWRATYRTPYTLIQGVLDGVEVEPELYDFTADPQQETNLAADKPEVVEELAALHAAWAKELPRPRAR